MATAAASSCSGGANGDCCQCALCGRHALAGSASEICRAAASVCESEIRCSGSGAGELGVVGNAASGQSELARSARPGCGTRIRHAGGTRCSARHHGSDGCRVLSHIPGHRTQRNAELHAHAGGGCSTSFLYDLPFAARSAPRGDDFILRLPLLSQRCLHRCARRFRQDRGACLHRSSIGWTDVELVTQSHRPCLRRIPLSWVALRPSGASGWLPRGISPLLPRVWSRTLERGRRRHVAVPPIDPSDLRHRGSVCRILRVARQHSSTDRAACDSEYGE